MKMQAWKGASVFLPQTFVVCVFFIFPIGQFCVVLCTCPLLFLPCGFFVFQPLISLFLPLLSFYFLSHSLPRLPAISPPHSHPHSISFSFSQHSQPLMIDQGFQGLPFPVIQEEMFMHSLQPYSHNWHVSTQCLSRSPAPIHIFLKRTFFFLQTSTLCLLVKR